MRKMICMFVILMAELFAPSVHAQGTLYISNLDNTPTGTAAIGSDFWIAQTVITGTNSGGYVLDSLRLLTDAASGSPGGFNVSIYSSQGGQPQDNLGNLVGYDSSAGGLFSYSTTSRLELSPSTFYYVVVTAATPIAQGAYVWSGAWGQPYVSDQQWTFYSVYYSSPDGSNWTGQIRQNIFQMAIYATAVPEPAAYALGALGALLLGFHHRRNSSR